jgi:hypothetical protein
VPAGTLAVTVFVEQTAEYGDTVASLLVTSGSGDPTSASNLQLV